MRHPNNRHLNDTRVFSNMFGELWRSGVGIDLEFLHSCGGTTPTLPRRVPIPGYSFEPTSYWLNPKASIYVDYDFTEAAEMEKQQLNEISIPQSFNCRLVPLSPEVHRGGQILFCFPYAGGSSRIFESWAEEAKKVGGSGSSSVQIISIELPGRGARSDVDLKSCLLDEKNEISEIAAAIRNHMLDLDNDITCVLCGLSMGAMIAWRVAEVLQDLRGQLTGVVLAGRVPPFGFNAPAVDCTLTEDDLQKYNLASASVRSSEAWQDFFLPLLENDLLLDSRLACQVKIVKNGVQQLRQLPSFVDLTVCCGMDDLSFPWTSAIEWKAIGGASFNVALMQGGHEFLRERACELFTASVSQRGLPRQDTVAKETRLLPHASKPSPLLRIKWQSLAPLDDLLSDGTRSWSSTSTLGLTDKSDLDLWKEALDEMGVHSICITSAEVSLSTHDMEHASNNGAIVVLPVPFMCDASESVTHLSPVDLMNYEVSQCWAFMNFAQKLVENNISTRIIIVLPDELNGSMIVGASRSLSLEIPDLETQRLFLRGPSKSTLQLLQAIVVGQTSLRFEPDIAIRGDQVQVRRAHPHHMQKWNSRVVVGRPSKRRLFLVTGGTGGIGTELVNWLIDVQGITPSQIVLLSRRNPSEYVHPRGCIMVKTDLAQPNQLAKCARLISLVQASDGVEGIFHLAGVLADSMLVNMTRRKIESVTTSKVTSFLELLSLAQHSKWGVKWAIVFSSTTSMLGYPGQSNYAAANAFLDGLVQCSRSASHTIGSSVYSKLLRGGDKSYTQIPIIGCNWGPWGEVGMAKIGTKAYDQSLRGGQLPMQTKHALTALESMLRLAHDEIENGTCHERGDYLGEALQYCICRTAWTRSEWKGHPLIGSLHDDIVPLAEMRSKAMTLASRTNNTPSPNCNPKHHSEVEEFLAARVSSWLPSETLTALGVDSLDEVQMRNEFQRYFETKIPLSTFVIPNQTLASLISSLEAHLKPLNKR